MSFVFDFLIFHPYFRFTGAKYGTTGQSQFLFLVDGLRKVIYDSDDTNTGTATITLQVNASQQVQVMNHGATTVYGSNTVYKSWFTGFLLFAI